MTKTARSIHLASVVVGERDGQPTFLLDLVDAWASHVYRLATEASASAGGATDLWGADDYIGALFLRDRLARETTGAIGESTVAAVAVADELFRRFTVPDESGTLRKSGVDVPDEPWWWQRVPRTGPVAVELAGW